MDSASSSRRRQRRGSAVGTSLAKPWRLMVQRLPGTDSCRSEKLLPGNSQHSNLSVNVLTNQRQTRDRLYGQTTANLLERQSRDPHAAAPAQDAACGSLAAGSRLLSSDNQEAEQ